MIVLVVATLVLSAGCRIVDPPEGYVELDSPPSPYAFQAVSPEDNRFAVRVVDNEGDGSLAFWVKAVRNQLERNRGYGFVSSGDLTTRGGLTGKEMLFETSSKGVKYLYLVGIFPYSSLFGSGIYIVEAGGEEATLKNDLETLRQAVKSLW
jgi:hypothetical protein